MNSRTFNLAIKIFILFSAFSLFSGKLYSQCAQRLEVRGIVSSWVEADKDYLNGRTDIYYYFEQEDVIYTLNIGGPIKVASDPFYNEEVAIYEMPFERSIDIDYYHQFLTAENIFKETLSYIESK